MVTTETNGNWVQRLKSDESERDRAIAELRSVLVRGLEKSLSSRYGGVIQAEDVVQDALIKIMASLDDFQGRSRFTTWAMTIATRVGISELRRRRYKDVSLSSITSDHDLEFDIPAWIDTSVDEKVSQRELLTTLKQLIVSELTERQRAAIQCSLDGLPVEEIARRTDSNRNAVYKLIHDARMRLKDGFAASGISAADVNSILA